MISASSLIIGLTSPQSRVPKEISMECQKTFGTLYTTSIKRPREIFLGLKIMVSGQSSVMVLSNITTNNFNPKEGSL
jgi:hypothetical protein